MAAAAPKLVSREVFVHIIVDQGGKISVDPDPFWVSKGANQEVVWHCTSTDPTNPHPNFDVLFNKDGTPFHDDKFSNEWPCSGLVDRNFQPDPDPAQRKIFHYTVKVGENELDPGGGVTP